DDLHLAQDMAARAANAVENARLYHEAQQAREEAETANRAKDEFLSVLSHELRTPLNSMFGWTRMLRAGILDEEKTQQAIEVIERNVRLQNSLIEDMLDVSRIITGKMRIEKEETDFAIIVKSSVEAARPLAEQKKVSLVFHADADSYVLLGDEVRLQQIVSNLINNAVKFTPEEGAVILSLSATTGGGAVLLNVTDSGIGIEPDFLPQIFDRFRQADSTTRRMHSGLGLGLTIVRHLTELHGGRVSAQSEGIGKGASFTIELPLLPKPSNDLPNNTITAGNGKIRALKGSRILLVDDDCDAMLPLRIILETEEAEVLCAASVREALELLAQGEFNLLVSDIGMPEMDGYDLITALRKMDASANHDIPAIALTAYASTQDKRRALMSGFQHHFAKPLDFEQFLATVNTLMTLAKNK
ncbi:MAG TPA: ATP-binding protein, partial [Pyrinomonadaceae bacterium]|nr:ATP-binding protein [Pyrinomonadaceae bacterium]